MVHETAVFFSAQLLLARAVKTSMGLSIGSMGCCQLWCLEPSHGTAMASAFRYVVSGGVPIAFSLHSAVKLAGTHTRKAHFWACAVKNGFFDRHAPLDPRGRFF